MSRHPTAPIPDVASVSDEVLELEPAPDGGPASAPHVALRLDAPVSVSSDTAGLLRERLRAAALFLAIVYLVFFVWNLFTKDAGLWFISAKFAVCCALSIGLAALLSGPLHLELRRLRALEYGYFGALIGLLMLTQFLTDREFIRRDQLPLLVAAEKNGILQVFFLMILYAALIPNAPRMTAIVVMLMALGPLLVLTLLTEWGIERAHILDHVSSGILAGSNALFVAAGAGLAIYIAHVLHGLRTELREARRFGHYQLGEKIGAGGMGEVYLAEHLLLKRPCAIKLIRADEEKNPLALARFEREVRSAARLAHPNTVEIYDYGHTDDGTFYYVMEFLTGLGLDELVKRSGPLPPGRAVHLIRQACAGLSEAHTLGLVHRDLKPSNLYVAVRGGEYDVAKILDFGLVKVAEGPGVSHLTIDRTVSGTPSYMSPEQAVAARNVDGRADVYSLGCILYFALTGRPPFSGENPMEVMIAHARDVAAPPSKFNPDIPRDLEAVVLRCLAKDPGERFATAKDLARALAACACEDDWNPEDAEAWWVAEAARALRDEDEKSTIVEIQSPKGPEAVAAG